MFSSKAQNSLKIVSGGFGHFIGGPAYADVSFADNRINFENRSQEAYDLENISWLYGGEGFDLRTSGFMTEVDSRYICVQRKLLTKALNPMFEANLDKTITYLESNK